MSISVEVAVEASTDLILGVAQVVYYLTDANPAAAAIFGLAPEVYSDLAFEPGNDSALREAARGTRFPQLAGRLATYVREGVWSEGTPEVHDALSDLMVGITLLQGKTGPCLIGPDGTSQVPDASADVMQQLQSAVSARLALDTDGQITVPMLAALAGVAEKTVRMAANPLNERPLKTKKEGASTFISAEDALEWLSRRGDFKPSRYYVSEGSRPKFTTLSGLAMHLRGVRTERAEPIEALARALKWGGSAEEAYARLEVGQAPPDLNALQPQHFVQLAERYGIPQPVEFARECYPLMATAYADAVVREQLS